MERRATEEARRRGERAAADQVLQALQSALCQALVEMAEVRGVDSLDDFLARRLIIVESLRALRPWEPVGLTTVRERDAAAIEIALRDIVQAARIRCGLKIGPA